MEGKVVYQGKSKKGTDFVIRYPQMGDAVQMWKYINKISKEKTFITFQGEDVSIEFETQYLAKQLDRISKGNTVQLLVFIGEKLVGIAGVDMKDRTSAHEGVFGISVDIDYRGEGIGKTLMDVITKEAEAKMPQLKIVTLGLFGDNLMACKIYQDFGFVESGRLPKGILHNGNYVDHIFMHKNIRD